MGCCVGCIKGDQDSAVVWYRASSPQSKAWQTMPVGFGYGQKQSYNEVAQPKREANRNGNRNGELAGRIVFYKRSNPDTNYSYMPEEPVLTIRDGDHLYAKAFLGAPFGRLPIGENNLPQNDDLHGRAGTILTAKPRAVVIYIDVDGEPQPCQHFCRPSADEAYRHQERNAKPPPIAITNAFPGCFLTYLVAKEQEAFLFLHFPLIGSLNDTNMSTGQYGETFIRCFSELLEKLQPGAHTIDMRVHIWYDHLRYDYYPLGVGSNRLGKWRTGLANKLLLSPHPKPRRLEESDGPIAQGSFTILLPDYFQSRSSELLDRTPPPELYTGSDAERLRKIARVVAAGQFCETLGLTGLPDWVVLSSPLQERLAVDTKTARTYKRETIDFAALWLNEHDPRPNAAGAIVECSMVRSEAAEGPGMEEWVFEPLLVSGTVMGPKRWPIKNKYINICRKGRRFSIYSTRRGSMSLANWNKAQGIQRHLTIQE